VGSWGPRAGARLDSLTGLRFAAAFAVLVYHLTGGYYPTPLGVLRHAFLQGLVGVSFFFVLSGFVLTWSRRDGDRVSDFYRRRLAKIGPLHVATWALMGVILVGLSTPPPKKEALASLVLVVPWIPRLTYNLPMNGPSWSLGCELFFYALFPVVVPVLRRLPLARRRLLLVAVVSGVVLLAAVSAPFAPDTHQQWLLYFFPPSRFMEFVLGVLLAFEVRDGTVPRVDLRLASLLALGAYAADSWAPAAFEPVAVTLVPFALLIVAAAQADVSGRPSVWRSRPLVTLGLWSFALYMVQGPVFAIVGHFIREQLNDLEAAVLGIGTVVICVAAAGLFYSVVEHPLEQWLRAATLESLRRQWRTARPSIHRVAPRVALDAARRAVARVRSARTRPVLPWLGGFATASVVGLGLVAQAVPPQHHAALGALGGPTGAATRPASAASGGGRVRVPSGSGGASAASLAWYRSNGAGEIAALDAATQACVQQVTAVLASPAGACAQLARQVATVSSGVPPADAGLDARWQRYLQAEATLAADGAAQAVHPAAGGSGRIEADDERVVAALAALYQLLGQTSAG